jgi:hydrogenase-4 component E
MIAVSLFTIMVGLFMMSRGGWRSRGPRLPDHGERNLHFRSRLRGEGAASGGDGNPFDVFVAVFVIGIMIYNINREFDHIDTDRLSELKG